MFLCDIDDSIASNCYSCIKITQLLHLMCPLFVMFESLLNWDSPSPFFFTLMCSPSFCSSTGFTGTRSTLSFICSHVLSFCFGPSLSGTRQHTSFFSLVCSFYCFVPDLTGISSTLCSHVFFFFLLVPAQPGCAHTLLSLLSCALSFCFVPGLTGTSPNLYFLCSHVFSFLLLWSQPKWDPPISFRGAYSCVISVSP